MIRILSFHLPHSHNFIRFMRLQNDFTGMNLDQWNLFYLFNQTITLDFDNYDPNSAWPVMIDDFVSFMKSEVCGVFMLLCS
jgi:DCN1-like protein 4/5